jgi:hypothetical protein
MLACFATAAQALISSDGLWKLEPKAEKSPHDNKELDNGRRVYFPVGAGSARVRALTVSEPRAV